MQDDDVYTYAVTVDKLKAIIADAEAGGLPGDAPVIIAHDGEGNWFSPCTGYTDDHVYIPRHEQGGDVAGHGSSMDDHRDPSVWKSRILAGNADARPCLLLWPT